MTLRPFVRAVVGAEPEHRRTDADQNERHEADEPVARRDDDPRRQRQLGAKAGEQTGKGRDDLPQNDAHHEDRNDDDRDRVNHGGLDLTLQLDGLFDVGRQALENRVENTAGLARRNHVREQRIERLRMLLHRIRQRGAAFDVGPSRENDRCEVLVFFLRSEDLETLNERQAGVDHDRELAREDRQVLRADAFARWLGGLGRRFLQRADLRDEDLLAAQGGNRPVHRFGDALASDRAAPAVSVRYMQMWPLPATPPLPQKGLKTRLYCQLLPPTTTARRVFRLFPCESPAPATTPTPRLIRSCSSSRFDDAISAVSSVISSLLIQRRERLIHRLHAHLFLTGLHRGVDLMDLVLANQVPDARRRHHDLERHDAAAADLRKQCLTDDAFEDERQLRADLALLVRRERYR